MERNYMRPDTVVELDFITEERTKIHWHENFEMLFVVSGTVSLMVEEERFQMKSGDMAIVNTNREHSYEGTGDLVLGRFLISYNKVRELLGLEHVVFWCNSSADRNEAYDSLRRIISNIFNQRLNNEDRSRLYLNSLYYQMLYILSENFLLSSGEQKPREKKKGDGRMQEIFAYIRNNYRQNITLEDIARNLYISPTYVSRYVKQKCGVNFVSLINSVRLSHAIEDLMYSNESVMKIALENGFADVSAFNRLFKETYKQTPSEFRKQHRASRETQAEAGLKSSALVREKVEEYLERHPGQKPDYKEELTLDAEADLAEAEEMEWNGCALRLINAGTAVDLLNASIREQILENQEQLGFRYVRFWDIYNPELYLDIHSVDGKQNYSRLNTITDFLVENQLTPYIELGFKGRRIIRNVQEVIHTEQRADFFENETEMKQFYHALFSHFIKRYGSREVSGWYFEYWEKPESSVSQNIAMGYGGLEEAGHKAYFQQFNIIARTLREQLPKVKIGGAGFPVRIYGEAGFSRLLTLWKKEEQKPDFLSLSCYPYMQEKKNGVYYEKRFSDLSFVRYNIEMAVAAMKAADFGDIPIHVTEYSLSLSSRNVLNDSCLKAAYLLYNTIDCMGKVEMMGHFFYTDAFAEARDTEAVLFGGNGFLTKEGIPKPGYYAMEFLNQIYPSVQKKYGNCLITTNDRGSLRLVCHNLKKPNYKYYLTEEDVLDTKDIAGMLIDREYLKINVKISNAKEGIYIIKTNILNSHHGSIQDKWVHMNMESELTRKELDYLQKSSVSDISIRETECKEGCIELRMELEPNEIRYVHIYRK